jgi:hypothetical protein
MDQMAVRRALEALIRERGEDYASLSRLLGRNPTYVQQFIKRGVPRRLSEEDRRRLADHFGVPERMLGAPEDVVGRAMHAGAKPGSGAEDYVLIPRHPVEASAGPGSLPDNEEAEGALAFQASWARTIASGGVEALAVIKVDGDSMEPTLAAGDHILVDTADRERIRDGIYVLRFADALHVKRVSVHPVTRRLTIRSDNAAYETWPDCDPGDVEVIGRVVWVGRKL